MMRITDTVKHLIIINVIFFVATLAIGGGTLFYDLFALHFPESDVFEPWQIITHMFMHGGFMHILFNMFALWMFGTAVEQKLGVKKFLFLYFSAGLGAAAFQLGFYYFNYLPAFDALINSGLSSSQIFDMLGKNQAMGGINAQQFENLKSIFPVFNATMVGASGCIMGILVAFGMLNPNAELMLIFLPIPIKAKYFIPGIIALDIISALTGQSFFSPSNTAFMAHVGGALVGFIIMLFWKNDTTTFNNFRID
ncbi:rhomboid family intramembrane serine protease [Bizionia gelidisalsuginis]|uniref:Rhomboid family intramembrane serine protease n=2 Tax=Bizionia TaxID=283785 RepID=A0A8H2LFD6_9FLAO|nr:MULTISPECIES: rhomboid family intramembrane serine protease [Bizionia]TYB70503.1 rhomboid family intramembrane serine protease [Bizionia saleffrena]TYC10651.1 rhomboid family intramembrane serine protease [Bizionia gelidisalsuginis]